MQILKLSMVNFGPYEKTEINFARVNYFYGYHGMGKTFLKNAIQLALTGTCRAMKNREGESELIREGASAASVVMVLSVDGKVYTIARNFTAKSSTLKVYKGDSAPVVGITAGQAEIYKIIGKYAKVLQHMFDVFAFPRMTDTQRKELIQEILVAGDGQVIVDYLGQNGWAKLPEIHRNAIAAAYDQNGIKGPYEYAVENRRIAGRETNGAPIEKPTVPERSTKGKREDVDVQLADVNNLIRTSQDYENDKSQVTGQRVVLEENVRTLKRQIKEFKVPHLTVLSGKLTVANEKLEKAQTNLDHLEKRRNANTIKSDKDRLIITIEMLKTHKDVTSTKSLTALQGILEAEHPAKDGGLFDEIETATRAVEDAQGVVNEKQRALDDREDEVNELKTLESDFKAAEEKLDSLKEPTKPEGLSSLDDAIAKRDDLKAILDGFDRLAGYNQQQEKSKAARELAQEKHDNWDEIARLLNPKSEELAALFGGGFDDLQSLMGMASAALGIKARLNQDFSIDAQMPGGGIKRLAWLSESEQMRVGISIQMALCLQMGMKTLIIDQADSLIGQAQTAMRTLLRPDKLSTLETVIILVAGSVPETLPNVEDLSLFSVDNGDAVRLGGGDEVAV